MKRNILMLLALLSVVNVPTVFGGGEHSAGPDGGASAPTLDKSVEHDAESGKSTPASTPGFLSRSWNSAKGKGQELGKWFSADGIDNETSDKDASWYKKNHRGITRAQRIGGVAARAGLGAGVGVGTVAGMQKLAKSQIWKSLVEKYPLLGKMFNPASKVAQGISAAVLMLLADTLMATGFGMGDDNSAPSLLGATGRGFKSAYQNRPEWMLNKPAVEAGSAGAV